MSFFLGGICEALKSGLQPRDLTADEVKALLVYYGKEWYTKFGFTSANIPRWQRRMK